MPKKTIPTSFPFVKFVKFVKFVVKNPSLLLLPLLLTSCITISTPNDPTIQRHPVSTTPSQHPPHTHIYLLSDKLHTGIVVPYPWLIQSGFIPPENFPNPRYVAMSWGDRNAYVNNRWLTPAEVFSALFLPSKSVMEFIPIHWEINEVCPNQVIWQKLIPTDKGHHLARFLNHSVSHDETGKPIVLGPSSWGGGVLLASPHTYYFPRICNVWTAQALETTGAKINPLASIHVATLSKAAEAHPNNYAKIWDGSGNQNTEN